MGTCTLPDMYALSPRAYGPWASGIHIRHARAHVIPITCITHKTKLHDYHMHAIVKTELKNQ